MLVRYKSYAVNWRRLDWESIILMLSDALRTVHDKIAQVRHA